MNDRELLSLAAQAAGMPTPHFDDFRGSVVVCCGGTLWNPITNDGDALRLAVKLRMSVDCDDYSNMVVVYTKGEDNYVSICLSDADGASATDRYAATRRAIVRAAAGDFSHNKLRAT